MKLNKLFHSIVSHGMDADPRGRKTLEKQLKKQKERAAKLEGMEKELHDAERLWNPFADSRIIAGTGEEEVKTLLVGIDIETPEILLADRLREKGERIDCLMLHHPEGRALADLEKVMPLQVDLLGLLGVSVNQSEGMLRPRMDRVWRAIHADNLFRTERVAELLDFPAFNCHTPADNQAWRFVEKIVTKQEFDDLGDVINALLDVPEFKHFARKGNPPIIVNGGKANRTGKITATEFTGGTNGPEEFIEVQARAGVGTILSMHATEKTIEKAKEHHINIIQCSHMASDTLGMNLMLDLLSKEEKNLKTIDIAGFVRIKRGK
ncbi:MAG: hypothetical protein PHS73_01250 [Candidatus Peribacteraceae bacterium]|nr:hypothetical protein [Candidatus Peribacteraceae bacterium]